MRRVLAALVVIAALAVGASMSAAGASGAVTWGLALSDWNFPHGPGGPLFAPSQYDATAIRVVVPYCGRDCAEPEGTIRGYLRQMSPLGMGQRNLYVVLSCHVWEPCGRPAQTLAYLRTSLTTLMRAFPGVRDWQPQNEPEDAAVPTNAGYGGAGLAAQLWLTAQTIAADPTRSGVPSGETILAGGFGMIAGSVSNGGGSGPGWYPYEYAQALKAGLGSLPAPTVWALHPYYDVQCNTTAVTADFIAHIDSIMGAGATQHFWLDELGVRLDHSPHCANADRFRAARAGTAAGIAETLDAETAAAHSYLTLPSVDPRIDHLFYYTPVAANTHCWSGGKWDSSLVSAADGSARPAFDVLARRSVPSGLAGRTLLPPSLWLSACGQVTPTLSAPPAGVHSAAIAGTVTVPRGFYTATEPMPLPTGIVSFYLDQPLSRDVLGASAPLTRRRADASAASYTLTTAEVPPGHHTVYAVYSDAVHKFVAGYPVTVSADAHALVAGEASVTGEVSALATGTVASLRDTVLSRGSG